MYPARFDYICESEGSWKSAVNTITHIGQRLHGVGGALPTINCVVSHLNLEELPDMVRFARDVGFAISFLPVELLAEKKDGVRNWEARFIRYRPEMGVQGVHCFYLQESWLYGPERRPMRAHARRSCGDTHTP